MPDESVPCTPVNLVKEDTRGVARALVYGVAWQRGPPNLWPALVPVVIGRSTAQPTGPQDSMKRPLSMPLVLCRGGTSQALASDGGGGGLSRTAATPPPPIPWGLG